METNTVGSLKLCRQRSVQPNSELVTARSGTIWGSMALGKVDFEGARTDWALKCTVITPQFGSSIHGLWLCGLKAWGLRKTPELVRERNILVLFLDITKHNTVFARLLTLCAFTEPMYLWNELIGRGAPTPVHRTLCAVINWWAGLHHFKSPPHSRHFLGFIQSISTILLQVASELL